MTYLHSRLLWSLRPWLCEVVDVVVDGAGPGVVVRPERRQHGKALLPGDPTFSDVQHVLGESVWISTGVVQSERDVAIRVDLIRRKQLNN